MLSVITTLMLTFHLLALNVATAGPLVCCWLQLRQITGGDVYGEAGKRLAWASFVALLVGVLLGFGLLVCVHFDENPAYWNVLERFPPRAYGFAITEVAFSLLCLLVYAASWNRLASWPWLHGAIALVSTTNLLYHFPMLMSAIAEIAARPELVVEDTITRPLVREVMFRPSVLAMAAHFFLASLAVAGVALMQIARRSIRVLHGSAASSPELVDVTSPASRLVVIGGRIALLASTIQLLAGFWILLWSSPLARNAMMGSDFASTSLIVAGLASATGLLHALGAVALGETDRRTVRRCAIMLLAVVLLMTGLLVRTRRLTQRNDSEVTSLFPR